MKYTQNDINKLKKQAQQIMNIKDVDHNSWLYEQYQSYLSENMDVITKALKYLSEKENDTVKRKFSENNESEMR